MNKKYAMLMVLAFALFQTQGLDAVHSDGKEQRLLTLPESIVVGGIAGAAEVTFPGQMLSYAMNRAIAHEPFRLLDSYKGFGVNLVGQMPITAMQKLVATFGHQQMQSLQGRTATDTESLLISSLAGVAGACIDTPCSAIQLYQQRFAQRKLSMLQAARELKRSSFRGFTANALLKEAPFVVGYQFLAHKGKEFIQPYVKKESHATVAGGVGAGILTALITQPGTVIRNKMQSDLEGVYASTAQTVRTIFQQEGMKGFFAGLSQRGARVAIAIPLYMVYTRFLEDKLCNK